MAPARTENGDTGSTQGVCVSARSQEVSVFVKFPTIVCNFSASKGQRSIRIEQKRLDPKIDIRHRSF